ncbi:type III toxin-antitoxin system ToxN/AbiQ family toxin [Enterococcus cecorum]|nr:type III toxin-antitoxin system ToxN/AbiQ family toxin [Enterococcus cecorum]MDZ5439603.1 type III toxin-antitoxin system ToxN/AbiQ family toxin [Enterococcus cecorum]MDZ5497655.1 type III toxin-antitoxin system ToxN/AbiQ family toxin [Enterococcus cecorum]MDZ5562295.1 type III toxin-antitoxin system ToxN/AbiQ family toxin [Enterococcus cecorum]
MKNLMNFFSLDEQSYHLLESRTSNEVLYNKSEHRPYGVIMSVGNVDYYVPMKHDLNVTSKPFLESAVYLVPSQTLNYPFSGFDFQHVLPIRDNEYTFTLNNQLVGMDQRSLATQKQNEIADKLEKYIINYKHYQRGENIELVDGKLPDTKTFKVSTLNYFHQELGLEPTFDAQKIQDKFSKEDELILMSSQPYKQYANDVEISEAEEIQLVLNVLSESAVFQEKTPWNLEVFKQEKSLGYLAYGESWTNDFEIETDLERLREMVKQNKYRNLYSEIDFQDMLKEIDFQTPEQKQFELGKQLNQSLGQIPVLYKGKQTSMKEILSMEQIQSKNFPDIQAAKMEGLEIIAEEYSPEKIYFYKEIDETKQIQMASSHPDKVISYFNLLLKEKQDIQYDFSLINNEFGKDSFQDKNIISNIQKNLISKERQSRMEREEDLER